MTQKPITIESARQKLGDRGKRMTDHQIASLLAMLRVVCNKAIYSTIKSKS